MTPILMVKIFVSGAIEAFWVNTQQFADELLRDDPQMFQPEPGTTAWDRFAALAGSQDFMS